MTPNEINRAISESVGWKFIPCHDDGFGRAVGETWLDPDGDIGMVPPNYHGDLNAIQEAIVSELKTDRQISDCMTSLYDISERDNPNAPLVLHLVFGQIRATAPQRCEAYLKTIGKWRNE